MTSSLKQHIEQAEREIADALGNAAKEYFDLGLSLYKDRRKYPYHGFQATLGNFSIAVELLLKCIVARKIFPQLYEGLSREAQAILTSPEAMPKGTLPNHFLGDLRAFTQKTIDLSQSISCFYLFYPDLRQEFSSHLKLLASIRNASVHGAVPSFQLYHLERVAYVACKLFLLAKQDKLFRWYFMPNEEFASDVVSKFDEERVQKVHKAIAQAQQKSKTIDSLRSFTILGGDAWDIRTERCPVCQNDGFVYGYAEEDVVDNEASLWYFKNEFECDECGLRLDDVSELELAGIETAEDITSELDKWREAQTTTAS